MHHISRRQLLWLTAVGVFSAGLFIVPRGASDVVGSSAWLVILTNGAISILPMMAIIAVGRRFPGKTGAEYMEQLLGKWLGKVGTGLVLFGFFIHIVFTTRLFLDIVSLVILPFTPLEAVTVLFFITTAYLGVQRLEPIARGAGLLVPLIIVFFALLLMRGMRNVDVINLQPLFHMRHSFVKGVYENMNVFFGVQTLWVTLAAVRSPNGIYKSAIGGMAIVTGLYLAVTVVSLGILGLERVMELAWPGLEAIRTSVSLANVTGPPGLMLTVIWSSIAFVSTALHIHGASVTGLRWLGLSSKYRTIAGIVVSIITGVLSVKLFPSRIDFFRAIVTGNTIGWIVLYVFPILLWLVAIVRGDAIHKKNA